MDKALIQKRTKELLEKVGKPDEFKKELQELLESFVDEDATKNYRRIIPDTGKFYGVPKPILAVISSDIAKFFQNEPMKAKKLLKVIWAEESFESKQIAGKSMEKFAPKNPEICLNFVSSALPDIDNWSVCDNLAMFGVEPIIYHHPELVLPLSEKWIKDDNKWIRRFGVVSLRGYKRIQISDKVFSILDLVMEDEDKDVKKAVSWIIREITKKNPKEVTNFLMKWAKLNPNRDTKWIIKDGMKKLSNEQQKNILGLLD